MSNRSRAPFNRGRPMPYIRHNRSSAFNTHMPFDSVLCGSIFPGLTPAPESEALAKAIMDYHAKLTPSMDEQQAVASLVTKVIECFNSIVLKPELFDLGHIEETRPVGSYKKGTMLTGHCLADLVVTLRELPSFLATTQLSKLLQTEFVSKEESALGEDAPECTDRPYGFDFSYIGVTVRIAFTTHPSNFKLIEAGKHVSAADQRVALASIRHARWAEEKAGHANVKAMIRILKDFKRRFTGFQYLNPWQIDLLAQYTVAQNPSNEPLSVPQAFKRVLQLLASGLFLPGVAGFIDPCEPQLRRVHAALTFTQQEELCCSAQTMVRILNSKFSVLFTTSRSSSRLSPTDLTMMANRLPGMHINPSETVYVEPPIAANMDNSVASSETMVLPTAVA